MSDPGSVPVPSESSGAGSRRHLMPVPSSSDVESASSDVGALEERIRSIVRENLHVEVRSSDADLVEEGLLDSLGLVELLFELERTFGIQLALDEIDIENFRSVARIAAFVAARGGRADAW